jgi:hypothetical protein
MKKLLLSSLVVLALMATSCKKERTCVCKTSGSTIVADGSTDYKLAKASKKDAKDACEILQTTYTAALQGGGTVTCEIN